MDKGVSKLKEYWDNSHKTIINTGAGISYMYGVSRLKQQAGRSFLATSLNPSYIREHPDEFYALMKDGFLDATFAMGPGPVHKQLVELEHMGMVQGIITNNLDCLHTIAGSTNVVEIQGSFNDSICIDCGEHIYDCTIWNHGETPRCPKCGGYMMPANFCRTSPTHDHDFAKRIENANKLVEDCDLLIVIGTTGFMSEQYLARLNRNAKVVQINPGHTAFDSIADLNIREDAAVVLQEIIDSEK